jgi:hypothetical protein
MGRPGSSALSQSHAPMRPRPVRSLAGTGALVKNEPSPGHSGIRANPSLSRAPSHVEEGQRQLRTLDQEIEGSNPSSPATPQHLGSSDSETTRYCGSELIGGRAEEASASLFDHRRKGENWRHDKFLLRRGNVELRVDPAAGRVPEIWRPGGHPASSGMLLPCVTPAPRFFRAHATHRCEAPHESIAAAER